MPKWMSDLGLSPDILKAALPLLGAAAGYFDAKNSNGQSQGNQASADWFKNRANTAFAPPQFSTGLLGQPWGRY